MESLLRWGIEHSTSDARAQGPPAERKDLDPGIIDAILGKSEAEQMKDDLSVAADTSCSEDDRVDALDHLEMVRLNVTVRPTLNFTQLIEQIDNANSKCFLWLLSDADHSQ